MSVLDRVATTSDCLVVREFVLIFLQVLISTIVLLFDLLISDMLRFYTTNVFSSLLYTAPLQENSQRTT